MIDISSAGFDHDMHYASVICRCWNSNFQRLTRSCGFAKLDEMVRCNTYVMHAMRAHTPVSKARRAVGIDRLLHVCMCVRVYLHIHTGVHICIHVCVHVRACLHIVRLVVFLLVFVYAHVCSSMCVLCTCEMFVHIHMLNAGDTVAE